MKATPITSALKRKYSPLKNEESTAQKESKKMLADETGVYVQSTSTEPGSAGQDPTMGYSGLVHFKIKSKKIGIIIKFKKD